MLYQVFIVHKQTSHLNNHSFQMHKQLCLGPINTVSFKDVSKSNAVYKEEWTTNTWNKKNSISLKIKCSKYISLSYSKQR